jgi:polyisoprenoid-binding protein YceI
MKLNRVIGLTIGSVLIAFPCLAQQLPGVVGHPESELVNTNPANAAAGTYVTDDSHTAVIGKLMHGNLAYLYFRFHPSGIRGTYTYDPENPEATKVEVTIDASKIDFGLPNFDRRVQSDEFMDVEHHPTITFVSTDIKRTDLNHGTMTGNLNLHGVTLPITFEVTYNGGGPAGRRVKMGFSATGNLAVGPFGIDLSENNVTDYVSLNIETEFINQEVETDVEAVQALQSGAQ